MPSLGSVFLFLAVAGGLLVLFQALGGIIGLGHDTGADASHFGEHEHPDSPLAAFNFRSGATTSGSRGF